MGTIKNVLSQSAFWQVNKVITRELGSIESALLLSDLIDKQSYYEDRNELINIEGRWYFFATSEQIEDNTTLSYKIQKKCIKVLKEHGLISTKLSGVPAKLHFTLCENKIWRLVNSSIDKKSNLVLTNGMTNNNIVNNNRINNNNVEGLKNPSIFPEYDKDKKSLFKNSFVGEIDKFKDQFKEDAYKPVDLDYYFNAVMDWNEIKKVARTGKGWIATARGFMRRDNDNKKLVLINPEQKGVLNQSEIDYLKM